MDFSTDICWTSSYVISGVSGLFLFVSLLFFFFIWKNIYVLLANNIEDVASDLCLHRLPITLLGKDRLRNKFYFSEVYRSMNYIRLRAK